MKNIKSYNQYLNESLSDPAYLMAINEFLANNQHFIESVRYLWTKLPGSWRQKIEDYLNNETLDLDKLQRIEQKYDIFSNVESLYKKGIKNIKDIYNNIFHKQNESAFLISGILVFLIACGLSLIFFLQKERDMKSIGVWCIILGLIFGGLCSLGDYSNKNNKGGMSSCKMKSKGKGIMSEIKVKNLENADTLLLVKDENGKYKVIPKYMEGFKTIKPNN